MSYILQSVNPEADNVHRIAIFHSEFLLTSVQQNLLRVALCASFCWALTP